MRLVQLRHPSQERKVALVQEPDLIVLKNYTSIFEMAGKAIDSDGDISRLVLEALSSERLTYDPIYDGNSEWKLLPAFDHPSDPMHCMISGTGLTHKASAENRQAMHEVQQEDQMTDSMRMFQWGLEGGHPEAGKVGVQPEWFYKGSGLVLRAHNQALDVPAFADDGGEEPEVVGIYLISNSNQPFRVGFATSNEFSDHVMEKKNYLYLAPSKIRSCSVGPELVIGREFKDITGQVRVYRQDELLWSKNIKTGEHNMSHSLANLEYHHFKYSNHRHPGQVHIHFFGADAFSFGENIKLNDGDIMEVQWEGMGRPLKNSLKMDPQPENPIPIKTLV